MSRRRSLAGRVLPVIALITMLIAVPVARAQRPPALAACAPLPGTLLAGGGRGIVAARSAGPRPNGMALDEAAGRVYINTATALLVLDAASGACLRIVPLSLAFPGPIAVDGRTHIVFAVRGGPDAIEGGMRLIFAARGSSIVAFAGASGARLATVPTAAGVTALLADPARDRVLGISDAELLVLDGRTGTLLRRVPLPSPRGTQVHAAALWSAGTLYVTEPRAIAVLDIASGALRSTIPLAAGPLDLAVDARTRHLFAIEFPPYGTTPGTYVFLATFDAVSGAALRQIRLATTFVNPESAIVALDGPRGHLFVYSYASGMNMVDTRTGAVLASGPSDYLPLRGAVTGRSGQVFVANLNFGEQGGRPGQAQGSLSVFDTAGAGYPVSPIGYYPTGLVVDQTTGRLFVTTLGTIADSDGYAVAGTVLVFDLKTL